MAHFEPERTGRSSLFWGVKQTLKMPDRLPKMTLAV